MKTDTDKPTWVLQRPFRPSGGAAWIAGIPRELWDETDNNAAPYRSTLRLFENGRELGPPHAVHATISDAGAGRYSFWRDCVYFSASDGGDPNANGHTYSVSRAVRLRDNAAMLRAIEPRPIAADWVAPERPLRCAVLGCGNRGRSLASALTELAGVELAWLVDASADRSAELARRLDRPCLKTGRDFAEALADPSVDAVFVTLPDPLHRAAAEQAFRAGKHVFLEKPVAISADDVRAVLAAWQASGRVLQIGYVLRSAPFYRAIRNVVRQGLLGPIRVASLSEQLDVVHGASFMRRWHADVPTGGLLVHKSCHDLDLICWLLKTRPRAVSSFGGADTFRKPAPAPFCSQCGERGTCPYVDAGLHEARTAAERADPTAHGLDRCVFGMDKSIVDNQVVMFEMANGTRGTFYFAMQGPGRDERRITLIGDAARLDGVFEDGRFTIAFADSESPPLTWSVHDGAQGGHGGGDSGVLARFLEACAGRAPAPIEGADDAMSGMMFAFAAERARRTGAVMTLADADFRVTEGRSVTGRL